MLTGYNKRVADSPNLPFAKNMVPSLGLRPIARKMDPRLEQFPVVAANCTADGRSDSGAFDNGLCFSECPSQYLSQISVRSQSKRKYLDCLMHSNEGKKNFQNFSSLEFFFSFKEDLGNH